MASSSPTVPLFSFREIQPGLWIEERGLGTPVLVVGADDAEFRRIAQRVRVQRPARGSGAGAVIAVVRGASPRQLVVSIDRALPGATQVVSGPDLPLRIERLASSAG